MVRDTKFYKNHGANPAERPTIRVKAGLQCASLQHLQQVRPLLWGETRQATQYAVLLQAAKVTLALSQLLSPLTDSSAADAHLARNGRLGEVASLQQRTGFHAAFFKLRTSELSWSPSQSYLV
jgi:hypothetical protein